MGFILDEVAQCPRVAQPASMTEKNCKVNWKHVRRIVIKDKDGVDPFNTVTQTDNAGLVTQITTKSVWDTAIALSTVDRLTLTPKASNFQMPMVKVEPVQLPDQTYEMPGSFPSQIATITFDGLNSDDHANLMRLMGSGRSVLFILQDGTTLGRKLSDTQVDDDVSVFFDSEVFTTSTRQNQTGATELDLVDCVMTFPFDELVEFQIFDTSAFGLTI